ncbi:MAG TPA: hypothetical protein VJ508_17165, partial [Saprospiraceae bacterium]|nr:hypothetical protein [Saprospiraceae bacterium]
TVSETTSSNRYIGFNDTDPDQGFTNIDYSFYLNGATLKVIENNVVKLTQTGVLVPGDLLKINRTGTSVTYYRNGTLIYTSATASSSALLVDVSFQSNNATLVGVRASFSTTSNYVIRRLEYDHASRLINTWHSLNGAAEILLTRNEYNEIGQLVDKKLHSTQANGSDNKQSVDYRYNIRGWLTSMNNSQLANDGSATNDDTNDYFGLNLLYQQSDAYLGSTGLFNGNISGMKWSSNLGLGDIKETGYNFSYDALNRLQNANARMNKTNLWQAGYYNESVSQYDLNGNIKNLARTGDGGVQIDNLTYAYGTKGNQLQSVTDASDPTKGFKESGTAATDYVYDVNGNMVWDRNKGGAELLTNGGFDNGNTGWTITDTGSRLSFSSNEVQVIAGSVTAVLSQAVIVTSKPYVVVVDVTRTAGTLTINVGGTSSNITTSGQIVLSVTAGGNTGFTVTAGITFAGTIRSVSLKGVMVATYNFLNLPEIVTQAGDQ